MTTAFEGMQPANSTTSTMVEERDLDRREQFCRQIALSAGVLALEGFRIQPQGSIGLKGPQDYLTETDAVVERHIRERIADAFPEDGFLGEETGGPLRRNTWVVDPIDGTANFGRGIPHFCIAIAFVSAGETELGAIYNPSAGELHFARRNRGAALNGEPIRVSQTKSFDSACVEFGWSTRIPNAVYLAALTNILDRGANVRRAASGALGLAYVSDGRSDAYAELHMNPWDCLAGLLLVSEAGGRVGPYLRYGGLTKGGAVLGAAPGVAEGISEAVGIPLERLTRRPRARGLG